MTHFDSAAVIVAILPGDGWCVALEVSHRCGARRPEQRGVNRA
jgi:hypothetical protein